jgi:hypothetical protein
LNPTLKKCCRKSAFRDWNGCERRISNLASRPRHESARPRTFANMHDSKRTKTTVVRSTCRQQPPRARVRSFGKPSRFRIVCTALAGVGMASGAGTPEKQSFFLHPVSQLLSRLARSTLPPRARVKIIRKAQPGIRDSPFRAERVERSKRMRFNPRFLNTTGRGTVQVPA